jgi:RNA polymerase sigma-70 factor (ECF subfamily)
MKKMSVSLIMKRAWKLFKNQDVRTDAMFGICLKNSWEISKNMPLQFNGIYKQNYSDILNYVNFKLHNINDSEEITNDVFVNFFNNIRNYDESNQLNTVLYSYAKNAIIDFARKRLLDKHINVSEITNVETGREVFQFVDNSNNDTIENKELGNSITNAINNLTTKYKKIAELFFIKDQPYDEIAIACEIPLGTVKAMISRVRTMLQANNALKRVYQGI